MTEHITMLMDTYSLSFSEVWLYSYFSLMVEQPLLWAIILSILFGRIGVMVVKFLITLMVVAPISAEGLKRFKMFVLVGSYISAQTTRHVPIRKITRFRRIIAYAGVSARLFTEFSSLRGKEFTELCDFVEQDVPWGSEVWYNGVIIRVTWYPNFRWGDSSRAKRL